MQPNDPLGARDRAGGRRPPFPRPCAGHILLQVDAAAEAARRAAANGLRVGFLTGLKFDWLSGVMAVVTILSRSSPDLAAGLMRGKIDPALLRPGPNARAPAIVSRVARLRMTDHEA